MNNYSKINGNPLNPYGYKNGASNTNEKSQRSNRKVTHINSQENRAKLLGQKNLK